MVLSRPRSPAVCVPAVGGVSPPGARVHAELGFALVLNESRSLLALEGALCGAIRRRRSLQGSVFHERMPL